MMVCNYVVIYNALSILWFQGPTGAPGPKGAQGERGEKVKILLNVLLFTKYKYLIQTP